MNQDLEAHIANVIDKDLIQELRQFIAQESEQSPESVTMDQINSYLNALSLEDDTLPDEICIHTLFEQQVAHSPQATAVIFHSPQFAQKTTYDELNKWANQVAHYLLELGIGPGAFVGICLESSLELVFGLLAVLKAGGICVLLDPHDSAEHGVHQRFESDSAEHVHQPSGPSLLGHGGPGLRLPAGP